MNLNDLSEKCWRFLGCTSQAQRRNWRLQEIQDALNTCMFRMAKQAPAVFCLTQESSLSIVSGTATYELDDYCFRILSMWTEDSNAHKVKQRKARTADRDGARNSQLAYPSNGPWEYVWQPRTGSTKSGVAGAATGATATLGTQTITLGASATALVAADVGRMIRLNGEAGDYKIVTIGAGGRVPTVDRPIAGRIQLTQGELTDGIAPNYAAATCRWDLGSPLGYTIKILPLPNASSTVQYRWAQMPRWMLNGDDRPPFEEEYHDLIWKGALMHLSMLNQAMEAAQAFSQEYESRMVEFKSQEQDEDDSDDVPYYETMQDSDNWRYPIDSYRRQ